MSDNLLSHCQSLYLFSTNSQSWENHSDLVALSDSMNGKMTGFHTSPLIGRESRCPDALLGRKNKVKNVDLM